MRSTRPARCMSRIMAQGDLDNDLCRVLIHEILPIIRTPCSPHSRLLHQVRSHVNDDHPGAIAFQLFPNGLARGRTLAGILWLGMRTHPCRQLCSLLRLLAPAAEQGAAAAFSNPRMILKSGIDSNTR
jgi:hypothetical protein